MELNLQNDGNGKLDDSSSSSDKSDSSPSYRAFCFAWPHIRGLYLIFY